MTQLFTPPQLISGHEPFMMQNPLSTTYAPGVGSWYMQPFVVPAGGLASGRLNALFAYSGTSDGVMRLNSTREWATGSTGTQAASYAFSHMAALYSRGQGASSTRLDSFWSNTWTVGMTVSDSIASAAGPAITATASVSMNWVGTVGSQGGYTTTSTGVNANANAAAASLSTSALSSAFTSILNALSGSALIPMGFNTSIGPGMYWLGWAVNSGITTSGTSIQDLWPLVHRLALYGQTSMPFRQFGLTVSNTSSQWWPGAGVYSATSASAPATMAFVDIRSVASHVTQYFNHVNISV